MLSDFPKIDVIFGQFLHIHSIFEFHNCISPAFILIFTVGIQLILCMVTRRVRSYLENIFLNEE